MYFYKKYLKNKHLYEKEITNVLWYFMGTFLHFLSFFFIFYSNFEIFFIEIEENNLRVAIEITRAAYTKWCNVEGKADMKI